VHENDILAVGLVGSITKAAGPESDVELKVLETADAVSLLEEYNAKLPGTLVVQSDGLEGELLKVLTPFLVDRYIIDKGLWALSVAFVDEKGEFLEDLMVYLLVSEIAPIGHGE
jgi:hypothetical protein